MKFWEDTWVGDRSLKDTYPRLFSISECKESTMVEIAVGEQENSLHIFGWSLGWKRASFEWRSSWKSK